MSTQPQPAPSPEPSPPPAPAASASATIPDYDRYASDRPSGQEEPKHSVRPTRPPGVAPGSLRLAAPPLPTRTDPLVDHGLELASYLPPPPTAEEDAPEVVPVAHHPTPDTAPNWGDGPPPFLDKAETEEGS